MNPASGVPQNFTQPAEYTVTAADNTTKVYTVTVTVASNSEKDITRFTVNGLDDHLVDERDDRHHRPQRSERHEPDEPQPRRHDHGCERESGKWSRDGLLAPSGLRRYGRGRHEEDVHGDDRRRER